MDLGDESPSVIRTDEKFGTTNRERQKDINDNRHTIIVLLVISFVLLGAVATYTYIILVIRWDYNVNVSHYLLVYVPATILATIGILFIALAVLFSRHWDTWYVVTSSLAGGLFFSMSWFFARVFSALAKFDIPILLYEGIAVHIFVVLLMVAFVDYAVNWKKKKVATAQKMQ